MCLTYRWPSPFQAPSQYGRAKKRERAAKKALELPKQRESGEKASERDKRLAFTVFLDPFSLPSCIWSLEQAIENRAKSLKNGVDLVIHGQEIRYKS